MTLTNTTALHEWGQWVAVTAIDTDSHSEQLSFHFRIRCLFLPLMPQFIIARS